MATDRKSRLQEFVDWVAAHVTGDEKGEAQIFLERLFQAFGQKGLLDVGGKAEFRIRKAKEDGGGTAFADYVWKRLVLVEMKKRGTDLRRAYRQAFDYLRRYCPPIVFNRFKLRLIESSQRIAVDASRLRRPRPRVDIANPLGIG